jgi:hypothetical protein
LGEYKYMPVIDPTVMDTSSSSSVCGVTAGINEPLKGSTATSSSLSNRWVNVNEHVPSQENGFMISSYLRINELGKVTERTSSSR